MTVWLKALMIGPPMLLSAALHLVALASMPAPAAVAAAALLAGVLGVLACGAGEGVAIRVLWGGRRLRGEELEDLAAARTVLCRARLGPPVVELRVRRDAAVAAFGAGRRTVVMSAGLVDAIADRRLPTEQAAAVLAHAAAVVRSGAVRCDPLLALASLPWRALAMLAAVASRPLRRIPTVALAWRARAFIVTIAAAQAIADDHVALAVLLAAIGSVSYGQPIARRRWAALTARIGDDGVVEAGLGHSLATLLDASATTPTARARVRRLDATARKPRPLGLVGHNPTAWHLGHYRRRPARSTATEQSSASPAADASTSTPGTPTSRHPLTRSAPGMPRALATPGPTTRSTSASCSIRRARR